MDKGQGVVVNRLEQYKKGIVEIERPFIGLSYAQALLAKSLITRADPATGIVNDISYQDLANLLTINPAPGRKNSGTPTKQTIRNYIKSIERACGEYFKVISEGQNLQFLFPELPKVFSKIFENREVNTLVNSSDAHENTEENRVFDNEVNLHLNTDVNTPNSAVRKLYFNKNINNNNNAAGMIGNKNLKQPITPNFYPSPETIARAEASGFSFAADANIIQEFIDKNTAWGSEFADFNPVYLCFLVKHAERKQQKSVAPNNLTRSAHERTSIKNNSFEAAMEQVKRDNPNAIAPSAKDLFPASKVIYSEPEHATHLVAMDRANTNLRAAIPY